MENKTINLDSFKLMHWLNARKVTPVMVAEKSGLAVEDLENFIQNKKTEISSSGLEILAKVLNVPENYLTGSSSNSIDEVIFWSANDVQNTKREVFRDGIHFYNYYTWPSPKGFVAPVILDILCPSDRLPALNNGHLEAAITINLGPGDIHGRWDKEISPLSFQVLESNKTTEHNWIVGDTYVEPCYCPHSYNLVTNTPAQILSYTVKSEMETVFTALNNWSDYRFNQFAEQFSKLPRAAIFLQEQMNRHGFEIKTLAQSSKIAEDKITNFVKGHPESLDQNELKTIAQVLGMDFRLLIETKIKGDELGKIHFSYKDSIKSIRPYKSYTVASMSASTEFTDLSGLYIKVEKANGNELDLSDPGNIHYGVSQGNLTLKWMNAENKVVEQKLVKGDALWVAPYVQHAFFGQGALIKMTNGENITYLNRYALSNTFDLNKTLKRSRHDNQDWGYDKKPDKKK